MIHIRPCIESEHSATILAIFNEAIANLTALYEYEPRTPEFMAQWFAEKRERDFPILGAFDDAGVLLGFATYGVFRSKPAYKYTIEHSIYIHHEHRGKGVGRVLLEPLIEQAKAQDYHCMVGAIDGANSASIHLHEQFGFTYAGTIHQAGFKFGEWLDLVFYQLLLSTPEHPVDG
ncbi:MAG: N-acetyltransferase family protein [Burkholderiaceae bacterium]